MVQLTDLQLATPFVVMCYVLPAVIHRFESYLIALEACQVLGLNVSPALALEALTKDCDNTDEHGEEVINFRSGMGPNYERLEFLGDCFLKMATSISTFVQQPDENEFEFHVRRMVMLCNKNLMETAIGEKKVYLDDGTDLDLQLYKYVRTDAFSRYVSNLAHFCLTNFLQAYLVPRGDEAVEGQGSQQERGRLAQADTQLSRQECSRCL